MRVPYRLLLQPQIQVVVVGEKKNCTIWKRHKSMRLEGNECYNNKSGVSFKKTDGRTDGVGV